MGTSGDEWARTGEQGQAGMGGDGPERAGTGPNKQGWGQTSRDGPEHTGMGMGPNVRGWGQTSGDGPERCCEYTDIFPSSSLFIYSLNYFPDIFTIYLFKAYYLEVTDIFLHFSH